MNTSAGRTQSSSKQKMSEKEKKRRQRGGRGGNVSGGWYVIWREVTSRWYLGEHPGESAPGRRTVFHKVITVIICRALAAKRLVMFFLFESKNKKRPFLSQTLRSSNLNPFLTHGATKCNRDIPVYLSTTHVWLCTVRHTNEKFTNTHSSLVGYSMIN